MPLETLKTYSDAFSQANDAGNLLLDEISPIVSSATPARGKVTCGTSRLGYPLCFDLIAVRGKDGIRQNEDPSIVARRDALAAVTLYNKMLVDLAEGKQTKDFINQVDELVILANSVATLGIVPSGGLTALVPPTASFAKDLAARFGRARANATVRQSILQSKDDIQELLKALADDTPKIYEVFRKAREADLFKIGVERKRASSAGRTAAVGEADKRLRAMSKSIGQFHESLTAYVKLLDQTARALEALVVAAETSPGTVASAALVLSEAEQIRERSEEFWNAIRKVRITAAGG
ncbi:MAG: hypothetical protein ABJL55_23450 [Roseibium sp.]